MIGIQVLGAPPALFLGGRADSDRDSDTDGHWIDPVAGRSTVTWSAGVPGVSEAWSVRLFAA